MSEQEARCQKRKAYKTDVTDEQWALIEGLIAPAVAKTGRKPTDLREILNTILYQNRTDCAWDMLPHDLCARSTTFDYYKKWQGDGTWERILDVLRGKIRQATPRSDPPTEQTSQTPAEAAPPTPAEPQPVAGQAKAPELPVAAVANREETPSFVIMDSQSVKTTEV